MGFFTKLEKLSEKYIEGFFKTRFAGHIQPAEIAKLLLREMRDNKTISVSKVYVPNEYTVSTAEEDWTVIEPVWGSLARELQDFLKQKAIDRGYEVVGEIRVLFEPDGEIPAGHVSVKSKFSAELPETGAVTGPAPAEPGESTIIADRSRFYGQEDVEPIQDTLTRKPAIEATPRALLVQKVGSKDGLSFPLGTRAMVIGRRRTCDICIDDANISRVHASLDYLEGDYVITDLGSTNGTFVNGARISRKKLSQSDQVRVGSTILEFRVV